MAEVERRKEPGDCSATPRHDAASAKLRALEESPSTSKPEPLLPTFSNSTTFCSTESSHTCTGESAANKREEPCETKKETRAEDNKDPEEDDGGEVVPDKCSTGRWTDEEHKRFVEALEKYGKNWKKIQEFVGTRSTTQARSHAQKYFSKIERNSGGNAKEPIQKAPEPVPQDKPELSSEGEPACKEPELPAREQLFPSGHRGKAALRQYKPGRTHIAILAKGKSGQRKRARPEPPQTAPVEPISAGANVPLETEEVLLPRRTDPVSGSELAAGNGVPKELVFGDMEHIFDPKFDNLEGEIAKPLELGERVTEERRVEDHHVGFYLDLSDDMALNLNNVKEEPQ